MKKNLVVIGYGGIGSTLHVPNAQKKLSCSPKHLLPPCRTRLSA